MKKSENIKQKEPVDLLWTGGWDSTFRLLHLVISEKKRVKPHYLISPGRASAKDEIKAMDRIRQSLYKKFPDTKDLLLPTEYTNVTDIEPDEEIKQAYDNILKTHHLGDQHEWMSRYCKQKGISNLETGMMKIVPKPKKLLFESVERNNKLPFSVDRIISTKKTGETEKGRFDKKLCSKDEYILFKNFSAPLYQTTKKELGSMAKDFGAADIMNMTWFCHRPLFGKYPCGRCNPCAGVIGDGLGYRIGWPGLTANIITKQLRLRAFYALLKKLRVIALLKKLHVHTLLKKLHLKH